MLNKCQPCCHILHHSLQLWWSSDEPGPPSLPKRRRRKPHEMQKRVLPLFKDTTRHGFFCPYVTPVTQAGLGGIRIQERGQVHEPRKESSVQGSSTARHRTQRPARERAEGDEHGRLVNTVGACLPAAERATGALDSPATPIQGHLNGWPRGALLWIVDRGFGYRFPDFS
jgi:hypothetical protein